MLVRKSVVGVAIGIVIVLAAAVWVAHPPKRAKVQLIEVIHTNGAAMPQTGWFMLSNPSPVEVLCIPMSIQVRAATGWVSVTTMSPTNDPFTYDLSSFPFDRVLTQKASFFFAPKMAVSNGVWRVTVRCTEKTSRDRAGDRINYWVWKYSRRSGALARIYSGRSYELSSSEP